MAQPQQRGAADGHRRATPLQPGVPPPAPGTARARILCLHGRLQDGELFSQRTRQLAKKLAGVADLHFVSAPHELPLAEGQSVPMRCWWHSPNMDHQTSDQDDLDPDLGPANASSQQRNPGAVAGSGRAGRVTAAAGPAALPEGWEGQVVRDWRASLELLTAEWRASGPFDGVLGFSNGAAAALLLAAHAVADPATFSGLRFAIFAGGYVPQPLDRLLPPGMTCPANPSTTTTTTTTTTGAATTTTASPTASGTQHRLVSPLTLASLHCYSPADALVPPAESLQLAECFRPTGRSHLQHDLGHCLPQKAPHTAAVLDFVRSAMGGAGGGGGSGGGRDTGSGRRGGGAVAAAAGGRGSAGGRGGSGSGAAAAAVDPVAAALAGIGLGAPSGRPGPSKGTAAGSAAGSASPRGQLHPRSQPQPQQQQQQPARMQQGPRQASQATGSGQLAAPLARSDRAPTGPAKAPAATAATSATSAAPPAPASAPRQAAAAKQPQVASLPAAGVAIGVTKAATSGAAAAGPAATAGSCDGPATTAPAPAPAPSLAAPPTASAAVEPAAVEAVEASEEQREEMEALEAIFMDEYRPISTAPPRFTIHLREPGSGEVAGGSGSGGPPSRLFSLAFTLPAGYPASKTPVVTITGPLGGNDPRRHALAALIADTAREAAEGSGAGCVFQVVEAAKEWIDSNLPSDIGERREAAGPSSCCTSSLPIAAGATATAPSAASSSVPAHAGPSAVAAAAQPPAGGAGVVAMSPAAAAAAIAAAAAGPGVVNLGWGATALGTATATGAAGNDTWWLREEADTALIRAAAAEAAASAPWRTGRTEAAALAEADAEAAASLQWGDGAEATGPSAPDTASAAGTAAAAAGSAGSVGSEWSQAGRWDYVVGLVGKPSAGKSTFFNAVTDPASDEDGARVAPFPFTTIAPNVGRGYCLLPDPAPLLGLEPAQCRPLHGYAEAFRLDAADPRVACTEPLRRWVGAAGWAAPGRPLLWRRVPVVVKDVAGLVPGAYQGRGRGNAFLNDLCDADVLIHVVDASGTTDREGQLVDDVADGGGGGAAATAEGGGGGAAAAAAGAGGGGKGGDPLDDIGWVREELHRWVYDNVRTKWTFVLRKPSRLPELFSGYHASRALVAEVLARVGVSVGSLVVEGASLAHWREAHLHRLVAHFLQARFPILLALNKADMSSSPAHIARVRAALPHDPAVPVSAATERWLCSQRRAGRVAYSDAASEVAAIEDSPELAQQLSKVRTAVLGRYGSTGAALALTCAVAMRPPRPVFPVSDLESCAALPARGIASGAGGLLGSGLDAKARAAEGATPGVLRDCVLLKPGSHIVDLFEVLKRPPYQLLEGDFIRAECSALTAPEAAAATAAAAAAAAAANGNGTGSGVGCSAQAAPLQQTWRVVKKEEVLDWGSCVTRIMTNRRSHWQANRK